MTRAVDRELRSIEESEDSRDRDENRLVLRERLGSLLRQSRQKRRQGRRREEAPMMDAWVSAPERERALVLNRELGRLAVKGRWIEHEPDIKRFRDYACGGRKMGVRKAEAFLRSGAHRRELRDLGTELARRYSWDVSDACWFVLTGELPYPPFFQMRLEAGKGRDHEQWRLKIEVPLWAQADTLARMLKAVQKRYLGRTNRPLSSSRLRLVDFVAPLRHEGRPWSEITRLWNKAHRRESKGQRNLERDYSDTYALLMRTRLQPIIFRCKSCGAKLPRYEYEQPRMTSPCPKCGKATLSPSSPSIP